MVDKNGIVGDVHAGLGIRQVSILGQESLDLFDLRTGKNITAGAFEENLTIAFGQCHLIRELGRPDIEGTISLPADLSDQGAGEEGFSCPWWGL